MVLWPLLSFNDAIFKSWSGEALGLKRLQILKYDNFRGKEVIELMIKGKIQAIEAARKFDTLILNKGAHRLTNK